MEDLTSRRLQWDISKDTMVEELKEDIISNLTNNVSSLARDFIMENNINNYTMHSVNLYRFQDSITFETVIQLSVTINNSDTGRGTEISSRMFIA